MEIVSKWVILTNNTLGALIYTADIRLDIFFKMHMTIPMLKLI